MKYRNDFVTNSSSSISLWSDYKIGFKTPNDIRLKYDKKITVYSGFPVDLNCKTYDLQTLLEKGEMPLVDLKWQTETLMECCELTELVISDIFIEYMRDCGFEESFEIKKCQTTDKLFLSAILKDSYSRKLRLFEFDPCSGNADDWQGWLKRWDAMFEVELEGDIYAELSPEIIAALKKQDSKAKIYNPYQCSAMMDGSRYNKEEHVEEWAFEAFLYACDAFLSDFISHTYKSKSFKMWFAGKHLANQLFENSGLTMHSKCLQPPPNVSLYNYPGDEEDCVVQEIIKEEE